MHPRESCVWEAEAVLSRVLRDVDDEVDDYEVMVPAVGGALARYLGCAVHSASKRCARRAEDELVGKLAEVVREHGLTDGEAMRVVVTCLGDYLQNVAKYTIREERHPGKPGMAGGLADEEDDS